MLISDVFKNKRLVRGKRRTKKIKKQINYRSKTHAGVDKFTLQGLSFKDLKHNKKTSKLDLAKKKRIKKREARLNESSWGID